MSIELIVIVILVLLAIGVYSHIRYLHQALQNYQDNVEYLQETLINCQEVVNLSNDRDD